MDKEELKRHALKLAYKGLCDFVLEKGLDVGMSFSLGNRMIYVAYDFDESFERGSEESEMQFEKIGEIARQMHQEARNRGLVSCVAKIEIGGKRVSAYNLLDFPYDMGGQRRIIFDGLIARFARDSMKILGRKKRYWTSSSRPR